VNKKKETTKEVALIVEAIIKDKEGKLLLLKRSNSNNFFKGKWQLPGGKVNFGEHVRQAIKREIKEETALDCGELKIKKVFSFPDNFNGFKGTAFLMVFETKLEGKISLSKDHNKHGFFSLKEIKEMELTPISKKSIFGKTDK
jgi:8-oxo-dGTP diphosphatase